MFGAGKRSKNGEETGQKVRERNKETGEADRLPVKGKRLKQAHRCY